MATDNLPNYDGSNQPNNDENGDYTYSYPRPSEIQPPYFSPTNSGNGQPGNNPYYRPGFNPYSVENQPPNANNGNQIYSNPNSNDGNQPPYYAPPGQTYIPNNGYQQPYNYQPGSLFDTDTPRQPAAPTLQVRTAPIPRYQPIWTNILLGSLVVVFILEVIVDGSLTGLTNSFSDNTLYNLGALEPTAVHAGQWWRLITVMFLHANLLHIVFNGYALYLIGRELETFYGAPRLLVIYFLSGLGGGVGSLLFSLQNGGLAVGASGAIFGLFGALAAFYWRNRQKLGRVAMRQFQSMLFLIVINLIIGAAIPNIDMFAHIGGLVSGLVLGYVASPLYDVQQQPDGTAKVVDKSQVTLWGAASAGWLVLEIAIFIYYLHR